MEQVLFLSYYFFLFEFLLVAGERERERAFVKKCKALRIYLFKKKKK